MHMDWHLSPPRTRRAKPCSTASSPGSGPTLRRRDGRVAAVAVVAAAAAVVVAAAVVAAAVVVAAVVAVAAAVIMRQAEGTRNHAPPLSPPRHVPARLQSTDRPVEAHTSIG